MSVQPIRARNETAPVEAQDPDDSDSDSGSELLTVEGLQQWARELELEEKNWETDVAVAKSSARSTHS